MFPFAIKLEQRGAAVRHVVGIHVSELKSHLGLDLLSTLHLPVATNLHSAHRRFSVAAFTMEVTTILCLFLSELPMLAAPSCVLASGPLVDKYQLLWQRSPCTFPQ